MSFDGWFLLVLSIPGQQGSERVRIWRALKGLGTAVLRDGVYLAPASEDMRPALTAQRDAVREIDGKAYLFHLADADISESLIPLFDRADDYGALVDQIASLRDALANVPEAEARRRQMHLRRELNGIREIDFFPSPVADEAISAMSALDDEIDQKFSPDEPASASGGLPHVDKKDFRGRVWATRKNIWIDRIASAWLIGRFIDPEARFAWLNKPSDCPRTAVGFDFDGADFTHVGERVTYEVLLHCFDLQTDSALARIGAMVRFLDVGGIPVPEASGFAALLAGARQHHADDDELLARAAEMLNFLYDAYSASA